MSSSAKNGRVFWTAAVVVILLDIITKQLAVAHLPPDRLPLRIVGNVVRFTLAYNPGAAFSMWLGPHSRLIFGCLAVVALVILYRLYRIWRLADSGTPGNSARILALGLVWGGAAGNLIDRIRSNAGVVDFIDIGVRHVRFWTFNVADSAVTVGAFILAFVLWQEDRRVLATAAAEAAARDEAPFSTQ